MVVVIAPPKRLSKPHISNRENGDRFKRGVSLFNDGTCRCRVINKIKRKREALRLAKEFADLHKGYLENKNREMAKRLDLKIYEISHLIRETPSPKEVLKAA